METKLCCVLAITIVGVAGNAHGNHGNMLANTEQRHGNMQHLRTGARFVTVKRNTGSYDDNKQGELISNPHLNQSINVYLKYH